MKETKEGAQKTFGFWFKTLVREFFVTVVLAIGVAFLFNTLFFQFFRIPSPSMEPNLVQGDFIVASKYSYGYGRFSARPFVLPIPKGRVLAKEPQRGDVVVFVPDGQDEHFIKRLIGLPGDDVQLMNGVLYLNGKVQNAYMISEGRSNDGSGNMIKTKHMREQIDGRDTAYTVQDTQTGAKGDNTSVYRVPEGQYFFLGDNRDNSLDSRYVQSLGGIGFVPAGHIVAKAEFILFSVDDRFKLFKPWTWGYMRKGRFLRGIT
jgi:signal peptidase I